MFNCVYTVYIFFLYRYLRGRLNFGNINNFIDCFNATLKKKYEIFSQPRETLRGKLLSVYDTFKKQETSETIQKGIYFFLQQIYLFIFFKILRNMKKEA